ncbi:MAG: hypothetical protein ACOX4G_06090 [Limnochordia bacterium]
MQCPRPYVRQTIYTGEPNERVLCVVGDLDGDRIPEIVIGARHPRAELFWLGRTADGTWQRYDMDTSFGTLEAGGVLYDVDGNGDLDFIAGQDGWGDLLFWWECPEDPTPPWIRRVICQMPDRKCHDQLVADLGGDGRPELYFWNQGSKTLFTVPIPEDPRVCPWPGIRPVVEGVLEEGLAVADVDGDGRLELTAGQSWYKPPRDRRGIWERHVFATGFVSTRVAAADLARI